jgi:hypothetical protein
MNSLINGWILPGGGLGGILREDRKARTDLATHFSRILPEFTRAGVASPSSGKRKHGAMELGPDSDWKQRIAV